MSGIFSQIESRCKLRYFLSRDRTPLCSKYTKGRTRIKSWCRTILLAPCVYWVSCKTVGCPNYVGDAKQSWGARWGCRSLDCWSDGGTEVDPWGLQRVCASAAGSFLKTGWRGGTGGRERHVDAVLLPSLTTRKDNRAWCVADRPWRCPMLVERVG